MQTPPESYPIQLLDEAALLRGVAALARSHPPLAGVAERYGPPPMWQRPPGFGTLLHIILEQQVSLASALAAYTRLHSAADPLTPERFLQFSDAELKGIGFSRQKAGYGRALSRMLLDGSLDLTALETLPDEAVREALLRVPGVGNWSADIYLLMVLLRPDVWPHGDRALALSVQRVLGLEFCPSYDELREMSVAWSPWRAVAARLFWHDYLSRRKEKPGRESGDGHKL
jgi:DNA-3-methyladenine glycosylase II